MADIGYIALIAAFAAALVGLVAGCAALGARREGNQGMTLSHGLLYGAGAVVSIGLLVYLVFALLNAEDW